MFFLHPTSPPWPLCEMLHPAAGPNFGDFCILFNKFHLTRRVPMGPQGNGCAFFPLKTNEFVPNKNPWLVQMFFPH